MLTGDPCDGFPRLQFEDVEGASLSPMPLAVDDLSDLVFIDELNAIDVGAGTNTDFNDTEAACLVVCIIATSPAA